MSNAGNLKPYRVSALMPWGVETWFVMATNHLSAISRVEQSAQPKGQPEPQVISWEQVDSEAVLNDNRKGI